MPSMTLPRLARGEPDRRTPEVLRSRSARGRLRLPVYNVVVLELGLGLALLLATFDSGLVVRGSGVLVIALAVGLLRWNGRWLTEWVELVTRFCLRSRERMSSPARPIHVQNTVAGNGSSVVGRDDPKVTVLRVLVPDLVVTHRTDHEQHDVGLAWQDGTWTAVLKVEPTSELVAQGDGANVVSLDRLACCLEDRGVVLDAIQVIWRQSSSAGPLPPGAPASAAYQELLGPRMAAGRRTAWVAVRLDPRRCPAAIQERGGGVTGAQRALIGALSRVRSALAASGIRTHPLDPDQLLTATMAAADLTMIAGPQTRVALHERWSSLAAGGLTHTSYAVTRWPDEQQSGLVAITGADALAATMSITLSPARDEAKALIRGVVRVCVREDDHLEEANDSLVSLAEGMGVGLIPLNGSQVLGLSATLPLGGPR